MKPFEGECPVCASREFTFVGTFDREQRKHEIFRCRKCDAMIDSQISSVNDAENISSQQKATKDVYTRTYTPEEYQRRVSVARGSVNWFLPYAVERSEFVEMGVGEGFLSIAAAEVFGKVYGLDIELAAAVNLCRQFPPPANLQFLHVEEFKRVEPRPISVLAMWHLLEHLPRPLEELAPFRAQLAAHGLIIGQVPMFREAYIYTEHFVFYNERSLCCLGERLGCVPILLQRDEQNDFLSFCFRKKEGSFVPAA